MIAGGQWRKGVPYVIDTETFERIKRKHGRYTPLWGAYMTDIIKDFEQNASGKLMKYLRQDNNFEIQNVDRFRKELIDLHVGHPTLIALGRDAFEILARNLRGYYNIWPIPLPHYGKYISKENYKKEVAGVLGSRIGR